jgi:hypothetical protein
MYYRETAASGLGFHKPLATAKSLPLWGAAVSEGQTQNLSIIGIWRRFIFGVITTMVLVRISIQSARVD